MRDFIEENGLWVAVATTLESKLPAKEPDLNRHILPSMDANEIVNMYSFLQKLEHCDGNESVKLHNYMKQSKLRIIGFGISPDSNQVVVPRVFSFTRKLGD